MSQQMSRLADEDSDRYESELEQANRKSSIEDDDQEFENPEFTVTSISP